MAVREAIGANCEPCLTFHWDQARRLGVPSSQLIAALQLAQRVKEAPATAVLELAGRLLGIDAKALRPGAPPPPSQ
ncbi:MAG: hypothetical protein WBU92_11250 [Candidatus Dormiibacterota bacterium]